MLMKRRHSLVPLLCGTFLACISASAAQQQDEAAIGGEENGPSKVGESFRDCPECPDMVVVPAGTFRMGAPESEAKSDNDERPVQRVAVSSFAVGVYEVTFAELDACAASGGCGGYRPYDGGWGRGRRPVVHVSWQDAHAYVAWLSELTGKDYRLLSESEWEYAARAGTATPFHTGATISTDQANYNGDYVYGNGREGEYRGRTLPVGSFLPNDWGLHDVHGNVWEWVRDCWKLNYQETPSDVVWKAEKACGGRECQTRGCQHRILRGGAWSSYLWNLRSAYRSGDVARIRYYQYGFRVARTLTP